MRRSLRLFAEQAKSPLLKEFSESVTKALTEASNAPGSLSGPSMGNQGLYSPAIWIRNARSMAESGTCTAPSTSSSPLFHRGSSRLLSTSPRLFQDAAGAAASAAAASRPRRAAPRPAPMSKEDNEKRMKNMALYAASVIVGMLGMTYLAVPLYRLFCQSTGYGGYTKHVDGQTLEAKIRQRLEDPNTEIEEKAKKRVLRVRFDATCGEGMPWRFRPTQREVVVRPGQSALAFFTAENSSNKDIIGVSSYNVQPDKVGKYFNKIQCFCFEEQKLRAGEKIDMPVFFYIDPEFASDPNMWNIDEITLGYTFFKVEEGVSEEETRALVEQAKLRAQRHAGIV